VRVLVATHAGSIPRLTEVGIDPRSLIFTFLVPVVSGVAFGLAPALHARVDVGALPGGRPAPRVAGRAPAW
jgi:hypothetical protein